MERFRSRRTAAAALVVAAILAMLAPLVLIGPSVTPVPSSPAPSVATPAPSASIYALPSPSASLNEVTPGPPPITETAVPCGSFDPACSRMPISAAGFPFTPELSCGTLGQCTLKMDVLYPAAPGDQPWPVIVAIPGGPGAPGIRSYLVDFAQLTASQGAVVFMADYRESPEWGGGAPTTYQDIGCAIRTARARAATYGGDGAHVTLMAHSLGPFFGSTAALSADAFAPAVGSCSTPAGSTKPDAFIGIAGLYAQTDVSPDFLDSFFGGSKAEAAPAWVAGDPYEVVKQPKADRIPVRLIHGQIDSNVPPQSSQDFEGALEAAGFDSQLTIIAGDHGSVLQDRTTIRIVMETSLALR